MTDENRLVREKSSKAILNNDLKSLEEYKFKKNMIKDINSLKTALDTSNEIIEHLTRDIQILKEKIEVLENLKGEK